MALWKVIDVQERGIRARLRIEVREVETDAPTILNVLVPSDITDEQLDELISKKTENFKKPASRQQRMIAPPAQPVARWVGKENKKDKPLEVNPGQGQGQSNSGQGKGKKK